MSKYSQATEGYKAGGEAAKSGNRPECVDDKHLVYMEELRKLGATNMFGARPFLMEEFPDLGPKDAATVLSYWMGGGK